MKEVVFEAGSVLKKMGSSAFYDSKNLRNIQFPDGLDTIGIDCFWGSGLEEVVLPESVKNVKACAFWGCE